MLLRVLAIFCSFSLITVCYSSQLWCQQGGGTRDWGPIECAPTNECYKFLCIDGQSPFITRGCGVPDTLSTGLANESCFQALSVCQYLGGTGHCHICSDKHMCNSSPLPSYYSFLYFIITFLFHFLR